MTSTDPHLIVIRGNSASGKTSLARNLQLAIGRGTANIGQDHFRRVVLREHDVPGGDNIDLIDRTVRHCLGIGYHVILEGILYSRHYGEMIRALLRDHLGPCHVFYLEVPLEETIRRHAGRPLSTEVTAEQIRSWHVPGDHLGVDGEVVLAGELSVSEIQRTVLGHAGRIPQRAVTTPSHTLDPSSS